MNRIEFVSHHDFPDDPYTKELVYLCIDQKYRIAYVRKAGKNGGLFWSGISLGVSQNGSKVYFEAFLQDSAFLDKDIKDFLEKRKWEVKSESLPWSPQGIAPTPELTPMFSQEEIPF